MNEISLLDAFGPDATELPDHARLAARERLLAECRTPSAGTRLRSAGGRRTRGFSRRWTLAGAGLVLAAGAAAVVLPRLTRPTPDESAGSVELVAASTPEFPYTVPGLGKPTFTAEPNSPIMAVYAQPDGSEVVLAPLAAPPDEYVKGEREITVDGRPGRIVTGKKESGEVMFVALRWEHRPGVWLSLTKAGHNATEEFVLALAHAVVDQPQSVGFKLTIGLVPKGWRLGMFKDDGAILSYVDPKAPSRVLTANWTPQPDTSRDDQIEGFESVETVTVGGKRVKLVRAAEFWRLSAVLPDGSGFTLMASRSFRANQVVAVAGSVRLTKS
ncbi:MAG: hypothetical protein HOU81_09005 [Hamadaea sp.]|uniref:hypothetical protein n=1 Tax=Hamadaea sp. TaxID=2024425 RepID=UPI0017D04547|nr:hypothetical protein [Hamadaea sp.]NUR70946.1 hypothetical protein [Hamadaea sp.]NUT21733.1 hypothetical protein [Hamadaea sp.]